MQIIHALLIRKNGKKAGFYNTKIGEMANFEEKLIALSSAETVKKAKNLLKQKSVSGVWRNAGGQLRAVFREHLQKDAEVTVTTGENTFSDCSQCGKGSLCAHSAALLMYCGRFHTAAEVPEAPPVYSKGLLKQDFTQLAERGMKKCAKLRLNVIEDQLHAPNQYKVLLISVKLQGASREYAGNLSNLRQLYFDKSLSVVLKFNDFPLHDQQIIRFLALNGEADNSNIALGAELAAELFHALPGFPRFFRNNVPVTIRPERAEAVLVRVNDKIMPGIRIDQAVLPLNGARLIEGSSGCWVGKNDEYFFIGGNCEAGFLRSFFRLSPRDRKELTDFPLPVADAGAIDPEPKKVSIMLDGGFDENNNFVLKTSYLYDSGNRTIICSPRSGKIGASGKNCFKRDVEGERNFENALAMFGMILDDSDALAVLDDPEKAGVFLDLALPEIMESMPEKIVMTSGFAGLCNGGSGLSPVDLNCRLSEKCDDAYTLNYNITGRNIPISWEKIMQAAMDKKNYQVCRQRIFKISNELGKFMRSAGALLRNINTAGCCFELPFTSFPYFCTLAGRIPGALPPEIIMETVNTSSGQLRETFSFNGSLRKYQHDGVAFMQYLTDRNFNALLADEMGLGKTVQLLALLSSRMSRHGDPSLIVCPASLTENWAREAARFVPDFRIAAPTGPERNGVLKKGGFNLLILSYTAVKLCQNELKKHHFEFLVLDEAQHIKNPGSGNARNCRNIHASHRIVLTGTPLENTPEDLWSVMDFLQPGLLGSLPLFRHRYAGIGNDQELQEEFTGRISPFIKRRTKAEVACDLPEKHERTIFCEMDEKQRILYNQLLADNRDILKSGGSAELFALLLRLRQCCCHPGLLPDNAGNDIASGKSDLLFELLHETIDSGHKVLLFSQFTSMLKLLIPQLKNSGIPFEYLDGSTRDRQARVDRFNNDPAIPLFLLSLKAGGTGLNLTSADTVIIYDPWWNPAVELQATDRTHRIGQTKTVSTIKLVMKDSVEEKVLQLQQKKRELFQALVENPAASGGVSIAELRALIE